MVVNLALGVTHRQRPKDVYYSSAHCLVGFWREREADSTKFYHKNLYHRGWKAFRVVKLSTWGDKFNTPVSKADKTDNYNWYYQQSQID
jgi:hypothetical protein